MTTVSAWGMLMVKRRINAIRLSPSSRKECDEPDTKPQTSYASTLSGMFVHVATPVLEPRRS